ncbi:MAG: hypothetical protein ABIT83_13550, partial [Massilia sp.]
RSQGGPRHAAFFDVSPAPRHRPWVAFASGGPAGELARLPPAMQHPHHNRPADAVRMIDISQLDLRQARAAGGLLRLFSAGKEAKHAHRLLFR